MIAATAGVLALAPLSASAHGYTVGALRIGHPWSKPTPPGAPTAAGYLTITNTGTSADRFIGASTPAAEKAEIHQMTMTGAIMRMRPVEGGLVLPAGQTVTFAPGGYHLMLVRPKQSFKIGDHIPATLRFEHAGEVKVEFYVQAGAPVAADHSGMDMR